MSILDALAEGIAARNRQRKINGEPLYRCKVGDKYLGYPYKLVKTKAAAHQMWTDDLDMWRKLLPFDLREDAEFELERVRYRVPKEEA